MKTIIVLCAIVVAIYARPEEQYTAKYDHLDIPEILSNKKLLIPYIHCALEIGKCTPEGKELRSHIKEALENKCAKCTEKQKESTNLVIKHLINYEEEEWNKLVGKYDPEKKYSEKYEKELREIKA